MLAFLEHAAIGAILVLLGSIALARSAVYFQRFPDTEDRFFSTSFASVGIVALAVTGAFYIGLAAFDAEGTWRLAIIAGGSAFVLVVPPLVWQWLGPRPISGTGRLAT